jgi:hypothetical protein
MPKINPINKSKLSLLQMKESFLIKNVPTESNNNNVNNNNNKTINNNTINNTINTIDKNKINIKYKLLLSNELIYFEFCEIIFHIAYSILNLSNFSFFIIQIKNCINNLVHYYKKNKKDKNFIFYPETKKHKKINILINKRNEQKRKEELINLEKKRYIKERNCLQDEDINVYNEDEEEEYNSMEDDDYY